jgi:hypothetical protein
VDLGGGYQLRVAGDGDVAQVAELLAERGEAATFYVSV